MEVIIRDSFCNITRIEKSDGSWESYVYDSWHNITNCLNLKGDWRKFTYKELAFLKESTTDLIERTKCLNLQF